MSKVFTVAWREFKQTVMRPVFLFAILGIPLLILAIGALAVLVLINHKEPALVGRVVILSADPDLLAAARLEFQRAAAGGGDAAEQAREMDAMMAGQRGMVGGPGGDVLGQRGEINVTVDAAPPDSSTDSLKNQVRAGELLAFAQFDQPVFTPPAATQPAGNDVRSFLLFVHEKTDSSNVRKLERRLAHAVVRVRAQHAGISGDDALDLTRLPDARTTRSQVVGNEQAENERTHRITAEMIPMVFMMLIWVGVFSAGQPLMLSTIEEKSNKVMEVLLSAVSPLQLMTGKILGYGAVGLVIVGIYSSLGIASLVYFAAANYIQWSHLLYFFLYFIMAYAMVSSIMAAVGSAVSDVREANTLIMPVTIILMIPLMLWMPISQSPNGVVATICSFVPPAIPFAMILRIVSEEGVPAWQIAASLVWGFICVIGLVWFAARVFRVGVLMAGKPPSIIELIKWSRYA